MNLLSLMELDRDGMKPSVEIVQVLKLERAPALLGILERFAVS